MASSVYHSIIVQASETLLRKEARQPTASVV